MKLRIATWNIGEDESNENSIVNQDSYAYIKEMIDKYKIDVLCLQEAITNSKLLMPIVNYLKENTELIHGVDLEYAESHINIGSMMGVAICSKYPLTNKETVMFDNPGLMSLQDTGETFVMHDKGFVMADVEGYNLKVITGHGIPFHHFKKTALDFKDVFLKAEADIMNKLKFVPNFMMTGDMNHTSFLEIFPNIDNLTNSIVNEPTRFSVSAGKELQFDYLMASKNIKYTPALVIDNHFDHKLCITDIEI